RPRFVRVKQIVKKRRSVFVGMGVGLGVLLLAGVAVVVVFGSMRPEMGAPVEVDWPAGLDAAEAADRLYDLGLVGDREAMTIFLKATGGASDFVPGPHLLYRGASPWELRRLLSRSILRASVKVTIPEGWNRFDIGARLEKMRVASKRAFVAASADPSLLVE